MSTSFVCKPFSNYYVKRTFDLSISKYVTKWPWTAQMFIKRNLTYWVLDCTYSNVS